MKQPPRLLDDPALPPELRGDLKRVAGAHPSYDTAVGLVALQAAITSTAASTGATAGGAAAGKAAASAMSAKLAIAAVSTAIVVAATTALWPKPASTPVRVPAAQVAPLAQPKVEVPAAPKVAPVPAPSAALPVPAGTPAPVRDVQAQSPARAQRDDDAELRREIAQLGRIKALIDRDPNAAARLALEGDREFRRGMLRQERGALAIFALWNAGRHAEATRRAQAFIERYPDSPSRARIERLLRGEQE